MCGMADILQCRRFDLRSVPRNSVAVVGWYELGGRRLGAVIVNGASAIP